MYGKFQAEKEAFEEAEKERRAREEEVVSLIAWGYESGISFILSEYLLKSLNCYLCRKLKGQERRLKRGEERGTINIETWDIEKGYFICLYLFFSKTVFFLEIYLINKKPMIPNMFIVDVVYSFFVGKCYMDFCLECYVYNFLLNDNIAHCW